MSERPIVEYRSAAVADVKFPERIVSVLAVPYETPTDPLYPVVYRGREYVEIFARGAFAGINNRQPDSKVMVNREHVRGMTLGRVEKWHDTHEGPIAEMRFATTPAGEEALTLTSEGMMFPSVGFYIKKRSDEELDHRSRPHIRYVKRAFVEHIGMCEKPAYDRVKVLSVRGAGDVEPVDVAELPHVSTPRLDVWLEYLASKRAGLSA